MGRPCTQGATSTLLAGGRCPRLLRTARPAPLARVPRCPAAPTRRGGTRGATLRPLGGPVWLGASLSRRGAGWDAQESQDPQAGKYPCCPNPVLWPGARHGRPGALDKRGGTATRLRLWVLWGFDSPGAAPNFVFDDQESSSTPRPPAFPTRSHRAQPPHYTRLQVVVKHLARGPLTTPSHRAWRIQRFFWIPVVELRLARVLDDCRRSSTANPGGFTTRRRRAGPQGVLYDRESQSILSCCIL